MSDNLALMDGSGTLIASDEVDGVQVLRVKVQSGADGTATDVSEQNPLPVGIRTAGLSVFRAVGLGASAQVVKSSPGRLFGWHLANSGTRVAFVKVYDAAQAPAVGSVAPTATLFVPPGSAVSCEPPNGLAFSNGISVAATTGPTENSTSAPDAGTVIVDLFYADADVAGAASAGAQGAVQAGSVSPAANTLAQRDSAGKLFAYGYDAGNQRVTQVAAPTQPSDAATKAYADARPPIMVAGLASVATASFTVIGRAQFDPTIFPSETAFEFQAIIEATPGQTAEIRLYNVTDAGVVPGSTLSTSNTTPTLLRVAVSPPSASKLYEVQLRLTNTPAPSDRATCTRAELMN